MVLTDRINSLEALHFDPMIISANRRVRRSVATFSPSKEASYTETSSKKIRLSGQFALFLKATTGSSSLTIGGHSNNDEHVCFKLHVFNVLSVNSEHNQVVMIESSDGRYITKDPNNPDAVKLATGNAPEQTHNTDDRFFRCHRFVGEQYDLLEHYHSGKYLSANYNGVSLVSVNGDPDDSVRFRQVNCRHT